MYCENCGSPINKNALFCDSCGKPAVDRLFEKPDQREAPPSVQVLKKNPFKWALIILAVLFLAVYVSNQRTQNELAKEIQDQKKQTKDLLVQIQNAQEQNDKTNKDISAQLTEQKARADQTSQALAAAQRKLAAQNSAPVKTNSDLSLPSINSKAVVMIICVDGAGNGQAGSGVIIGSSGYVLTNKHVVTDGYGSLLRCVMAMRGDDTTSPLKSNIAYALTTDAANSGLYPNFDAAILKVTDARNIDTGQSVSLSVFPTLKPSGGNIKQGDSIYILGYPGASNFVFSVFRGIISSFSDNGLYINTDAVIDHGNSGGAAVTGDGRFVGIPTQKYVGNGDYLGQILELDNLNIPNF